MIVWSLYFSCTRASSVASLIAGSGSFKTCCFSFSAIILSGLAFRRIGFFSAIWISYCKSLPKVALNNKVCRWGLSVKERICWIHGMKPISSSLSASSIIRISKSSKSMLLEFVMWSMMRPGVLITMSGF